MWRYWNLIGISESEWFLELIPSYVVYWLHKLLTYTGVQLFQLILQESHASLIPVEELAYVVIGCWDQA